MATTTTTDNTVPNTISMEDRDTARAEFTRVCGYLHGRRDLDARLVPPWRVCCPCSWPCVTRSSSRPYTPTRWTRKQWPRSHSNRTSRAPRRSWAVCSPTRSRPAPATTRKPFYRFDALVDAADGEPDAQCLAVRAYLAWWKRDKDDAMRLALEALALSEECTLAGIVFAALNRNILPREQS